MSILGHLPFVSHLLNGKSPHNSTLAQRSRLSEIRDVFALRAYQEPFVGIFNSLDGILRLPKQSSTNLPSLLSSLTLNTFRALVHLREGGNLSEDEQESIDDTIAILESNPENYTYSIVNRLEDRVSDQLLKERINFIEKLLADRRLEPGRAVHLLQLIAQNSPRTQNLIDNLYLLEDLTSIGSRENFRLLSSSDLLDRLFAVKEKEDIPKLLKLIIRLVPLDEIRMSKLNANHIACLTSIIDNFSGGERLDVFWTFIRYHFSAREHKFDDQLITTLIQTDPDRFRAFFRLLQSFGNQRISRASQDFLFELSANKNLLEDKTKEPILRRLISMQFADAKYRAALVEIIQNQSKLEVLLDPSFKPIHRNGFQVLHTLVHNFEPEEIGIISHALSMIHSYPRTQGEVEDRAKNLAISFTNQILNNYQSNKEAIIERAKAITVLLSFSRDYTDEFMDNVSKLGSILSLLQSKASLSTAQQVLLVSLVKNQEQFDPACFQHMIDNVEYLTLDRHNLTSLLQRQEKNSIEDLDDLAWYCFMTMSGDDLARSCHIINRLSQLSRASITYSSSRLTADILKANEEHSTFRFDLPELIRKANGNRMKTAYRIVAHQDDFTDNEIRKLINLKPKTQPVLIHAIETGKISDFIRAFKDSGFDYDVLRLINHTELYRDYIQGHPYERLIVDRVSDLIEAGAFPSLVERFTQKAINYEDPSKIEKLSQRVLYQAALAAMTLGDNTDFPDIVQILGLNDYNSETNIFRSARLDSSFGDDQERQLAMRNDSCGIYGAVYDMHYSFPSLDFELAGNSKITDLNLPPIDYRDLPWLQNESADLADSQYIYLEDKMIIIPPKTSKYQLPRLGFNAEHYSLLVYSDKSKAEIDAVAYLVPTSIIEQKLKDKKNWKFSDLNSIAKANDLNILNLGWVSNLSGMCNAYPVGSDPYFSWELSKRSKNNHDSVGHLYRKDIYSNDRNLDQYIRNQLSKAHTQVYEVSNSLLNLMQSFRYRLSLQHKQGDYMLRKAYDLHNNFHSQTPIPERNNFPLLAIAPTFRWASTPKQEIYLDTFDMTVHKRKPGNPEIITQLAPDPTAHEQKVWNDNFIEPTIYRHDTDLRFVDRSSMKLSV